MNYAEGFMEGMPGTFLPWEKLVLGGGLTAA